MVIAVSATACVCVGMSYVLFLFMILHQLNICIPITQLYLAVFVQECFRNLILTQNKSVVFNYF